MGIPDDRDRSFRRIVTDDSGLSRRVIPIDRDRFEGLTGMTGHEAGIVGHDT